MNDGAGVGLSVTAAIGTGGGGWGSTTERGVGSGKALMREVSSKRGCAATGAGARSGVGCAAWASGTTACANGGSVAGVDMTAGAGECGWPSGSWGSARVRATVPDSPETMGVVMVSSGDGIPLWLPPSGLCLSSTDAIPHATVTLVHVHLAGVARPRVR
jgi:hypothetical protein